MDEVRHRFLNKCLLRSKIKSNHHKVKNLLRNGLVLLLLLVKVVGY